ncbi:hypothetical protein HK096_001923 [Nowakowskiella sp. JEL0078]|nr:hypothetical protein HK096_001923 [Nowakowskiella sp. JEL0078]
MSYLTRVSGVVLVLSLCLGAVNSAAGSGKELHFKDDVAIVTVSDAHFDFPNPDEQTLYASPTDSFGYRVIYHQRNNILELHKRAPQGGGGASSVKSTTTTTTTTTTRTTDAAPTEDSPTNAPVSPTPASPTSARSTSTSSVSFAPTQTALSIGGPIVSQTEVTTSTSTSTSTASSSSSTPIIAGVVAGSFALLVAAGGVYIFRKFTLKPSEKFEHRLSGSYDHVIIPSDPPSHSSNIPLNPYSGSQKAFSGIYSPDPAIHGIPAQQTTQAYALYPTGQQQYLQPSQSPYMLQQQQQQPQQQLRQQQYHEQYQQPYQQQYALPTAKAPESDNLYIPSSAR